MHLDNLIFLLLIAIAALFRFLVSKAGNAGKSEPPEGSTSPLDESTPVPRPPADTDEERIRRFLEALGQPTSSKPPPPVPPRTHIPPRSLAPVQPPSPALPIPTRIRRRTVTPTPTKETVGDRPPSPIYGSTRKPAPMPAAEPVFEVQERAAPVESRPIRPATAAVVAQQEIVAPDDKIDITALLNSPSGLRNAIVLREIFGPPRSLQALDLR